MKLRIRNEADFWAGLMFVAFGAGAIFIAQDYPAGSAMRMGPGYFPSWIGACLIGLGVMITAVSLRTEGEPIGSFALRPSVLLALAFAIFGWAIDNVGFIIAMVALIVLSAAAGREFRWREVIVLAAVLIAGSWALFIWGLELPFPMFWWR